ncbi:MAG: hypothetical protein DLM55_10700 [Acidimicrobiales bacterium]|nr:MAG: hypothetical protein DLM55_10700 [Acidimicrobiales bacterium]
MSVTTELPDSASTDPIDQTVDQKAADGQAKATRGIAQLVKYASEQLVILVREELKLARLELSNKRKRVGRGAALLGMAALFALYAIGVLIAAGVLGVAQVFQPWLAALIVGGGLLFLAAIFAVLGKRQLKAATPPVPPEVVENLKADMGALKGAKE